MTGRWFRFYEGVVDDPKAQRLAPPLFKAWVNLLCLASRGGGRLPSMEDITFSLRMSVQQVSAIIGKLVEAELLDEDETGTEPHNWNGRQFQSDVSTVRVKRHRERKRNGECNADETLHETPPEQSRTEAETEQKSSLRSDCASELQIVPKPEEPEPPTFLLRSQPKKRRLPDDFEPSREAAITYWTRKERADLCRDVEDQVTQFKAHHRKLANSMADWDSAWVTWYSKAPEMVRPRAVEQSPETPSLEYLEAQRDRAAKIGAPTHKLDRAIAEKRCGQAA